VLPARKPRDAKAILFGLKFANDIHYKLRCSQASTKQGFRAPNIVSISSAVQAQCANVTDRQTDRPQNGNIQGRFYLQQFNLCWGARIPDDIVCD